MVAVACESLRDKISFLLVEDNDDHAALVRHAFRRGTCGVIADRVTDGVAALAYLRKEGDFDRVERPDIVLLDLNLPRLDGHEVLRQIKADPCLRSIPVVIMTSSDDEADRCQAYDSFVNSYVLKPADLAEFRELLDDLTEYWGGWNRPCPVST